MSDRAPQPAAVAAFLAWPAPVGGAAEALVDSRRMTARDGAHAAAIAVALCLLLAVVGMALPIALGLPGAGVGLRSHLSLFCHLI